MPKIINVIEPTLKTEAGHCYSFIRAFCTARTEPCLLRLWISRGAQLVFPQQDIQLKKYFLRKIRRLQGYFLYKKLLARPEKLFISTAGHADLLLVQWAATEVIAPEKVYFYFHWYNINEKKLARLKVIARKQPNLVILGPTLSVIKIFQDAGFNHAEIVPYPVAEQEEKHRPLGEQFRHLLYAGAAREDKGFSHVVDLVAHLHARQLNIPVVVQTSPEHYGKLDEATEANIRRLCAIPYPFLTLCPETLDSKEYAELFVGAVGLQLYDPVQFADRVSGVTLDAFLAGSPIITTARTWIARMAQRFDAGKVMDEISSPLLLSVAEDMIANYAHYHQQAYAAGEILQQENSAKTLFELVAKSS